MTIRIVIADDHPLILKGLEDLFKTEKDFEVVARCSDGIEIMEAVRRHQPDILILDIRMPLNNGLELIREMKKERLFTKVIILTAGFEERELLEALRLGVQGFVLKEMAPEMLLRCVRKVQAGEQWIKLRSAKKVLVSMLRREAGAREIANVLTSQEMTIMRMVSEGLRNKEIAHKLHITEGTVKAHLHNIFKKLHLGSRMALFRYVQEKGLV